MKMAPHPFKSGKLTAHSYKRFCSPLHLALERIPKLTSRSNRPLQMEFEDQLHALIYFHLQEHTSGRHLLQSLKEDAFAREHIAPKKGIAKSSFFEAMNERGLEQFLLVFEALQQQASKVLPDKHPELGQLVAVDGSLIDAVLSMDWADYRKGAKKAKTHIGFDLNRSIPRTIFLTDGKAGERPFVERIIQPGETAVSDRGYQSHHDFDQLQAAGKHFVSRIKENTLRTCLESYPVASGSIVFYDAKVLLGREGINQTQTPLRLVGYTVGGKTYWVATDRFDLTAEQMALIYKLRWDIETFFAWWKRHLKVYHLISRSRHGLMIQMLAGLITYLLLAIYCHEQHGEPVNIHRVRQLRNQILNESRMEHSPSMTLQGEEILETIYASP
ncbi:MAG: IS4 family transposase [Geobacteraceae bacterium]|nr:MAG: IS4 family transposase [Geobacteraceae bacterium]